MTLSRTEKVRQVLGSESSFLSFKVDERAADIAPKVCILCRVSSLRQANEKTIEVQLNHCQELFIQHFSNQPQALVHTSINENLNLEKKELHFDFFAVLDRIQLGEINTVVCVSYDRVFRGANRVLNAEISQIFTNNRVKFITADGAKQYEPTNVYGSLIDAVQESLGVVEKKNLVRKLQKARRHHLVERKQWKHCVVPFGYEIKTMSIQGRKEFVYSIVEDEAEIVRDLFRLYVNAPTKVIPSLGDTSPGVKVIANHLNRLGVSKDNWLERIPNGHQAKRNSRNWNSVYINRILTNPIYRGEFVVVFNATSKESSYHGEAIAQKIAVPAVVSLDLWEAVSRMREKKSQGVIDNFSKSAQHLNILHRVLVCPTCGRPMTGFTSSRRARYYLCRWKRDGEGKHREFAAVDLEWNLGKIIMERLREDTIWEKMHGITGLVASPEPDYAKELVILGQRHAELNVEYQRLAEFLVKGTIDEGPYHVQSQRIKTELSTIDARRRDLEREQDKIGSRNQRLKTTVQTLQQRFHELVESGHADLFLVVKAVVAQLVEKVELVMLDDICLATRSIEEIRDLFHRGRIVPKDIKAIGWSDRRITALLGRSGRRTRLDFDIRVTWRSGKVETITSGTGVFNYL